MNKIGKPRRGDILAESIVRCVCPAKRVFYYYFLLFITFEKPVQVTFNPLKMNNVAEVEKSIASFSEIELASFREWFYKFDHHVWDMKLANDIESGKLDVLAKEALKDFTSGNYKEI